MKQKNFGWLAAALVFTSIAWGAQAPSSDDQKMMKDLAEGSSAEIELGKLVINKSKTPEVKAFAERMVRDHQKMLDSVQASAKKQNMPLDSRPGQEELKIKKEISSLQGTEFDKKYIEGMLDDHKHDVAKVARFIVEHPQSSLTPQLKKELPVLEDHLRVAENVAGRLGIAPDAGLTSSSAD